MRLLKVSQRVHLPLCVVAMRCKNPRQLVAPCPPIGFGEERPGVEQLVQQDRMARQIIGGPRGRAHQLRQTRQKRRMLDEQREIGAPPAHFLEERKQAQEHRLWISLRRSFVDGDLEQHRHQPVEALTR